MRKLLKVILLFTFCCNLWASPSVLLLNPGKEGESFWKDVDLFASAAATRLDLDFKIFHAERDNYQIIKEVERLVKNKQLPDYLLLVNEKKILPKLLYLLEDQEVFVIIILNGLSAELQPQLLQNQHWKKYLLSSLIPDNYWIGQQTAKALHAANNNQAGKVLLISGDKDTPASIQRQAGALDYFNSQPDIKLSRLIYAHWDEQISYAKSLASISREPDLKYIWTANDLMAFGSLDALNMHGLQPGKDVFVSTVNTSEKVLALRKSGDISVLAGGHFTAAGWALVMISNHLKGKVLPKNVNEPLFQLINPSGDFYYHLTKKNWNEIPFEKIQPNKQGQYNFKIDSHPE